jgi:hypothetical protein
VNLLFFQKDGEIYMFIIDAQIIVDLFINYDCSMRSANIFERLVIVLSRAAQGRQAVELGITIRNFSYQKMSVRYRLSASRLG